MGLRPSQIRVNFENADPPLHVWDAPPDEGDGAPRQSYNFAPGYNGVVYRAEVPDYGCGPAPEDKGSKSKSKKTAEKDVDTETAEAEQAEQDTTYEPATTTETTSQDKDKETHYILSTMKWGLIPSWTKRSPDYRSMLKTINCRSDSLSRPGGMWASMKSRKRCIVVTQGFYEWKKIGPKEKQPYYTKRKDGQLLLMAGLWDCVRYDEGGEKLYTYSIITTDSNKQLGWLHDRMPVIFDNGSEEMWRWLDPKRYEWSSDLQNVLKPYEGELECYAVAKEVGKVGNNDESFIVPVASKENKKNIANFFGGSAANKGDKKAVKTEVKEEGIKKEEVRSEDEDVKKEGEGSKPASPAMQKAAIKKEEEEQDEDEQKEIRTMLDSPNSENNAPAPVPASQSPSSSPKKSLKREYTEEEEPESVTKPPSKAAKTESRATGCKTRSATQNDRGVFGPEKKKRGQKEPEKGAQKITGFFKKS